MRHAWLLGLAWLTGAGHALAQGNDRLEIGGIIRADRVSFEGHQNARLPVAGAGISYRVWRNIRIEGEITSASGQAMRSYEVDFISYAGPGATREEIQRMAVIARRTTINRAGLGFALGAAAETRDARRMNLTVRAGVSFRQYDYIDDIRVLSVPDGGTFEQAEAAMPDSRGSRGRGGLLFGASVPIRVAGNLRIAPEARWVWGGPARVGNNYDEATFGARALWKF